MMRNVDGGEQTALDSSAAVVKVPLLSRVTCPHCWHQYAPEDSVWISSDHKSLRGDPIAGQDAPRRFSAERFDVQGNAIDAREQRAQGLACPRCHLEVPRALYEYKPFFVSIVGAPGSGKSFFLPAMTWFLRSSLPEKCGVSFQDADPRLNVRLHEYETTLFLNTDRETPVTIKKTELQGERELVDKVILGNEDVELLRPFVFRLEPTSSHPLRGRIASEARAICMYDNAGEHFLAAAEGKYSRLTNHLEHCDLTLFLFDATMHARFRQAARSVSQDPQWTRPAPKILQNTILDNAATRLRNLRGLSLQQRYNGPLVVVLSKFDAWANLLPANTRASLLSADYLPKLTGESTGRLRFDAIQALSGFCRTLLMQLAPEIVAAAEGYSSDVTYIPVSATGCAVRELPDGNCGVRPRHIQPKWCELPLLAGLVRGRVPLIRTAVAKAAN
jgi:hypothetical protein